MKIRVLTTCESVFPVAKPDRARLGRRSITVRLTAGDVADLPDAFAERLLGLGLVEPAA